MALHEPGLAAADVGDKRDGEWQIRFLPEIADLARLAVIDQAEIGKREISNRRAVVIGNRACYGNQIDVDPYVGVPLRREHGGERDCRNRKVSQ